MRLAASYVALSADLQEDTNQVSEKLNAWAQLCACSHCYRNLEAYQIMGATFFAGPLNCVVLHVQRSAMTASCAWPHGARRLAQTSRRTVTMCLRRSVCGHMLKGRPWHFPPRQA